MLKNPIPKVTNQLQHRAIGIINGKFAPVSSEQLKRDFLIELPLAIKKMINKEKIIFDFLRKNKKFSKKQFLDKYKKFINS